MQDDHNLDINPKPAKEFSIWDLTLTHSRLLSKSDVEYTLKFKSDKSLSNSQMKEVLEQVKDMLIVSSI